MYRHGYLAAVRHRKNVPFRPWDEHNSVTFVLKALGESAFRRTPQALPSGDNNHRIRLQKLQERTDPVSRQIQVSAYINVVRI